MFIIQFTFVINFIYLTSVINFILIIILCLCRATDALINVRLDYNNLRKK